MICVRSCLHERSLRIAHRESSRRSTLSIVFPSLLLSCFLHGHLFALTDTAAARRSGANPEVILALRNFNFDCYRDTVIGWADDRGHYLPREIHWGAAPANTPPGNDSACASPTPHGKRQRITTIRYPNWKHITGSVAFEQHNEDSLADILLYLWGDPTDKDNPGDAHGNGARRRDTLRAFVVFAQVGLDSIRELNVGTIRQFQTDPFYAMELEFGDDLFNPASRDLSGFMSYELKRIKLDLRPPRDSGRVERHDAPPQRQPAAGVDAPVTVRVFPNPTGSSTNVEIEAVEPGAYTVEVVAVNGALCLRQEVAVETTQSLLRTFDVSRLASGYYVIRLYRLSGSQGSRPIGTYPVVIAR